MSENPCSRILRWFGLSSAFACVLSSTLFGQNTWRVAPNQAGALTTAQCAALKSMVIHLWKIEVRKTPGDGGSYEEWDVTFPRSSSHVHRIGPHDNLSTHSGHEGELFQVDKNATFDGTVPSFRFEVGGKEADPWPNPDDQLPEFGVTVVNGCWDGQPTGYSDTYRTCEHTSDRSACYIFFPTYVWKP